MLMLILVLMLMQVGWLGEDSWSAAKAGLLKLWERTEVVVANGSQLGGKLAEAIYRKYDW